MKKLELQRFEELVHMGEISLTGRDEIKEFIRSKLTFDDVKAVIDSDNWMCAEEDFNHYAGNLSEQEYKEEMLEYLHEDESYVIMALVYLHHCYGMPTSLITGEDEDGIEVGING